jgi:hypothetical protein
MTRLTYQSACQPAKLIANLASWRHMQFSSVAAPSLYSTTAQSVARREITSFTQVRNADKGDVH